MPRWDVRFDLKIELDNPGLIRLTSEAHALARVIHGVPIPPGVREQLDRLNIHRAVRGTTGIEGVELSEEEVDRVLRAPSVKHVLPNARKREEQEVRNAKEVLLHVAEVLDQDPERPLTEEQICELHRLTTKRIAYSNNVPGEYRNHPVHAGEYSAPPTGEEVRRLMKEFVAWLNEPPAVEWPPIIRAIAAHFYLISIHPFGDGNGRTARAVESYLLYQAGINVCGFYSLSNFYYKHRQEYEAMLDHVRFGSGDNLTPFVRFAAVGLVDELEAVHAEVLKEITLIAYRDYAHQRLTAVDRIGNKVGRRMFELVQVLAAHGELQLSDPHVAYPYGGLSKKTLIRDLVFLEQQGLIVRTASLVRANLAVMEPFKISRSGMQQTQVAGSPRLRRKR